MSNTNRATNTGFYRPRRTTQPRGGPSRWYPQKKDFPSYQVWDTHYRAFQRIYELQDQVAALTASVAASAQAAMKAGANAKSGKDNRLPAGSIDATHILGIAVKATVPTNGQRLTYVSHENQFIFQ